MSSKAPVLFIVFVNPKQESLPTELLPRLEVYSTGLNGSKLILGFKGQEIVKQAVLNSLNDMNAPQHRVLFVVVDIIPMSKRKRLTSDSDE